MASTLENNTSAINKILNTINNLPEAGTDLPELTNEGTAADLLSGKELINSEGEKVTGTIATKTASNLTASGATVTVPAGYYASQATKSVATATQATPSVSIDSAGKITATATQTAGYVSAGTKTGTKQLTVQASQTITPSTSDKTIASGRYLTGTQTIKGDANLKAANIAKGVSIFGVTGTHEGGEDISAETAEYTAQLDELEATIDGLPDAGGGSVETCTVHLNFGRNGSGIPTLYYMTNGVLQIVERTDSQYYLVADFEADKNTVLYVANPNLEASAISGRTINGGTFLGSSHVNNLAILLEADEVTINT